MTASQPFPVVAPALHPRLAGLAASSATLAIDERSRLLAAEGREIFRFGLGQSPFPVPEPVVRALRDNARRKDYLPVRGLPALRRTAASWFARRSGIAFDPANIIVAPGSKELLFLIQMALDAVLILPSPSWVSYHPQSRIAGNPTLWVDTREEDGWRLTPAALREALKGGLGGRTGALLLNSPNNPTGAVYAAGQLEALADEARRLGLMVLSDEIYGEVEHRGAHESIARFYPEGAVVTTGLSKWCGAGGWRLGLAAFPAGLSRLADAVAAMASETYTSVSAPIQFAAVAAFGENAEIERYLKDSRRILAAVQRHVRERLLASGVTAPEGAGGFYLFCSFERLRARLEARGIGGGRALAEALLTETGIAALPGDAFGRGGGELSLRLSYVDFDGEAALRNVGAFDKDGAAAVPALCPRIAKAMGRLARWLAAPGESRPPAAA